MNKKHSSFTEALLQKPHESASLTPIELAYKNLTVNVKVKKQTKTIIHGHSGRFKPKTFTAILGPSGSGKTTLLNFLSGRLVAKNMDIYGEYSFNSVKIDSVEPYANQIAYIMQDDILVETMTPKQCLAFSANMRLRISKEEREARVQALIGQLGLGECCDTRIGNNLKKGISGGERKRTSIGIELITNPAVIFLDEPTTGLDSTTALQVVLLLRQLANQGRTVVSTIHQPSSEVFNEFDKLFLIVEGRNIYQGDCKEAEHYFKNLGYECPLLMNQAEYYMDLMSFQFKQQLEVEESKEDTDLVAAREKFKNDMIRLENNFKSSAYSLEVEQSLSLPPATENNKQLNVSGLKQFTLLLQRSFQTQIRNFMDFPLKLMQALFTALIVYIVFGRIDTTDIVDFRGQLQNIRGVIFFLVSFNTFAGLQGTLATFSGQKPMFLRERFSNTYSTWSYFWARSISNIPFELIYPTIPAVIVFYGIGLNQSSPENFPLLLAIVNALFFCAASYGLFYSAVIPKLEVAMALVPVLIIPFMMLSGFFKDLSQISKAFYPLEFLSPFRYGFQACMLNEFKNKPVIYDGLDYTPSTLLANILVLVGIGLVLRLLAFVMMYFISNPKRPKVRAALVEA